MAITIIAFRIARAHFLPSILTRDTTINTTGAISNALGTGFVNTQDFMHGEMYIGHFRDIRPDLQGALAVVVVEFWCVVWDGWIGI